jgi:hypothetical protein
MSNMNFGFTNRMPKVATKKQAIARLRHLRFAAALVGR